MLAARNTSIPAPEPKSTTVSPSLIKANFVGVPHPAPRIDASGIDFSSFEYHILLVQILVQQIVKVEELHYYFLSNILLHFRRLTEGPQHESPVRATFAYLSFTFSFIFSESVILYVY